MFDLAQAPKADISQELADRFLNERQKKDRKLGKNRFDSDNRWTGQLAETAFNSYCRKIGIVDMKWVAKAYDGKDPYDFSYGRLNIDVKCFNHYRESEIKGYHSCPVLVEQAENKNVNTYVFTRFFMPVYRIYLLGWIDKSEFLHYGKVYKQGERVGYDEFTAPADLICVPINKLKHEFIDLDRWK